MPIDITDQTRRTQLVISGTGPYPVNWEILDEGDVALYRDATLLTLTTDYTVAIGADGKFSITLVSATGTTLTIIGARPYQRITDYSTGGDFRAATLNAELDGFQIQILQLDERIGRAFTVAPTSSFAGGVEFPEPGAGKTIRWNTAGTALEAVSADDIGETFTQSGDDAVALTWTSAVGSLAATPLQFKDSADADDVASFTRAIAAGHKYIRGIPGTTYNLPAGAETISAHGVGEGDAAFDMPLLYAVMISGKTGVTIDLTGCTITTDHGTPFAFYRCIDCRGIGGNFVTTGTTGDIDTHQASAVAIARSYKTRWEGGRSAGYYRAFFSYRSPNSGFIGCLSTGARYFGLYASSELDVAIGGVTSSTTRGFIAACFARGGRHGNIFVDNADALHNHSEDCAPSSNNAAHISTQYGNCRVLGNHVHESSAQNSGDLIYGILIAPAGTFGESLSNVIVDNNEVDGCYQSIGMTGVQNFRLSNNKARNYYMTGIQLLTQSSGSPAFDHHIRYGVLTGNQVGNINDASTRTSLGNDKVCGLQIEENNSVVIRRVAVHGNQVESVGLNATKVPEWNVYIEGSAATTLKVGANQFTPPTNVPNFFSGLPDFGTPNGATVKAEELGNEVVHKTILTCTATPVTITDDPGQAQYGGTAKLYDFPEGLLEVIAVIDGAVTLGTSGTIIDAWAGGVALGTVTATTGTTLTGTEADIMAEVDVAAATAKVASVDAVSAARAMIDGTGGAKDLFLNIVVDDDASHTAGTGSFTGTISIVWSIVGDK